MREREVKRFKIVKQNGRDLWFVAEVQGGTYIRKLVDDLGIFLGVGAHMTSLRRLRAGIFSAEDKNFITLDIFDNAAEAYKKGNVEALWDILIPAEIIGEIYSIVQLKREYIDSVLHGKKVESDMLVGEYNLETGKKIAIFCGLQFIETATVVKDEKILAKPDFVLQKI
jgi:H/ACA ribonucleoprotein complex subunit 4